MSVSARLTVLNVSVRLSNRSKRSQNSDPKDESSERMNTPELRRTYAEFGRVVWSQPLGSITMGFSTGTTTAGGVLMTRAGGTTTAGPGVMTVAVLPIVSSSTTEVTPTVLS